MNVFHTELHKSHVQVVKVCSDKVTRGEDVFRIDEFVDSYQVALSFKSEEI